METDRELLAMAAKAAGIRVKFEAVHDCFWIEPGQGLVIDIWNPLQSDGDALRLAVKLNIEFACFDKDQVANAGRWTADGISWSCLTPYNGDKQAAVRRAIVRASADIGRAMK